MQGVIGGAFDFDGNVTNYLEIPDDPILNPANAFTVDGWFYIDPAAAGNDGGESSLVAKTNGNVGDGGWFLWFQDSAAYTNALRFDIMTNGSPAWPFAEVNNIISSAAWYHVAGTFDLASTPQAKLYVNGDLVASSSSTISSILGNSRTLRIGASHWTDVFAGGNDRLEGMADEVRFFDRALSASEIAAIYSTANAGQCKLCTTAPANLLSWWRAENDADDSINGNLGTAINGATYDTGKVGSAFSLDGVDDEILVPDSASLDVKDAITLEVWIFRRDSSHAGLLDKGAIGTNGVYELALYQDHFYFRLNGAALNLPSNATIPVGQWTHVAGTYDGITAKIYINGNLDASQPSPARSPKTTIRFTLAFMVRHRSTSTA